MSLAALSLSMKLPSPPPPPPLNIMRGCDDELTAAIELDPAKGEGDPTSSASAPHAIMIAVSAAALVVAIVAVGAACL
eukprot:6193279-Pleurochrysis_carterae.AAC.2